MKFRKGVVVGIEVLLLVVGLFSFSYFVGDFLENDFGLEREAKSGKWLGVYKNLLKLLFSEKGLVSAVEDGLVLDINDSNLEFEETSIFNILFSGGVADVQALIQGIIDSSGDGVSICTENNDGSLCQTYAEIVCEANCAGDCVRLSSFSGGDIEDIPEECRLGVCLDPEAGTCEPRSPYEKCTEDGGEFLDPNDNDARCRKGCCFLGDQGKFITNQQCRVQADSLGLEFGSDDARFDGELLDEFSCITLAIANRDLKGACVFPIGEEENDCRFLTYDSCFSEGGQFHEGKLCSYPELNTICEKKNNTACVDDINAIYWFDSCGNRENIFDGRKPDDGWNGGEIGELEDRCEAYSKGGGVQNQETCGSCDYFRGTQCGEEISGEELDDNPDGNVVCRDLSCVDRDGDKRENGESWCAYQSKFGVLGAEIPGIGSISYLWGEGIPSFLGGRRSIDTPGSRHFRTTCMDGEIVPVACQNYRNEICVESQSEKEGVGTFSQASCRLNRWQECLNYNPHDDGGGAVLGKIKVTLAMTKCDFDPDCFVKYVNVDGDFQFPFCAPKYPPGFDLRENPDGAEAICSYATQKCTTIYVKKLSGWECEANCDCETDKFASEMNDLCVSLGDCGASVNYMGDNGAGGYVVKEGKWRPKFGLGNILGLFTGGGGIGGIGSALVSVHEAVPGDYIDAEESSRNLTQSFGSSSDELFGGTFGSIFDTILGGTIGDLVDVGGYGGGPRARPPSGPGGIGGGATALGGIAGGAGTALAAEVTVGTVTASFIPAVAGFGSVLAGAGIGMAVVSILLDVTGVGRGLPPALAYGLVGAAGVAGAFVGYAAITQGAAGACAASGPACIIVIIIVIIILILKFAFGIGEIDEREYTFECQPWQAPFGGARCEECGKGEGYNDDLPCSRYSCESLGQSCMYVGEEPNVQCVDSSPNDVSGPRISAWDDILEGWVEYQDVSNSGFKVRKTEGHKCITQFESLRFGVEVDEWARCRLGGEQGLSFEESVNFGASYLSMNHSFIVGERDLGDLFPDGFTPDEETEINLYVKCQDTNGNENPSNFIVNVCVFPVDLTAPAIGLMNPPLGTLAYGTEEQEISVIINEPADLRWSFDDIPYDEMTNIFDCGVNNLCNATIPIDQDEVTICVKGADHPEWVGTVQEGDRNINEQCQWITLTRSENPLEIVSMSPSEEIIKTGLLISTVELVIETSGGDGTVASCTYTINGQTSTFAPAVGTTHRQILNGLIPGEYSWNVGCVDAAENIAQGETSFTIELDSVSPLATRVYDDSGSLVVVTNEEATCGYVTEDPEDSGICGFVIDDVELMSGSGSLEHSISFDSSETYYVRCKDSFGNEPSECSVIVSGGEF